MAKKREAYESSRYAKLVRWIRGGSGRLDSEMTREFDEQEESPMPTASIEAYRASHAAARRWSKGAAARAARRIYVVLALILSLGISVILLATAAQLPPYGDPTNPANNEVARRYIEQGQEETGIVNIVAGMILDYRAFDTLGESNVLFAAACTVMILLRITAQKRGSATAQLELEADDRLYEPKNDMILQVITRMLFPVILMYGAYVILNGHISPGGGFSGGAVMGAGLILYLNAYGFKQTERFFSFRTFSVVSVSALSFYALSKAYSFFTGANDLHSVITPGTPGRIFSAGLIPYLNIAVGLVVCCTMYAFYTLFRKGDM